MAKKNVPAWQQVLLAALRNTPKARDGHDAWERMTDDEKSGVMGFLAEQCGAENAERALEESCAMIGRRKLPGWLRVILTILFWFAVWQAVKIVIFCLPTRMVWVIDLCYCALLLFVLVHDDRSRQLAQLWHEREQNLKGPRSVLEQMHNTACLTRWQALDKGYLILIGIWMAMHLFFSISVIVLREGMI